MTHLEQPLACYFVVSGPVVRIGGVPLLGLPGSLFENRRDVLRAVPVQEMRDLVHHFIRRYAYGGIADIHVLRGDHWRDAGQMLLIAHDRGRTVRKSLCTVPWWSDEECKCWALSGELDH